jgi:hypothetical protein
MTTPTKAALDSVTDAQALIAKLVNLHETLTNADKIVAAANASAAAKGAELQQADHKLRNINTLIVQRTKELERLNGEITATRKRLAGVE